MAIGNTPPPNARGLACAPKVMLWLAALMVTCTPCIPVPPGLVALTLTLNTPAAVGVPLIWPLLVLTFNPPARPLAPKLAGELAAVIW